MLSENKKIKYIYNKKNLLLKNLIIKVSWFDLIVIKST